MRPPLRLSDITLIRFAGFNNHSCWNDVMSYQLGLEMKLQAYAFHSVLSGNPVLHPLCRPPRHQGFTSPSIDVATTFGKKNFMAVECWEYRPIFPLSVLELKRRGLFLAATLHRTSPPSTGAAEGVTK